MLGIMSTSFPIHKLCYLNHSGRDFLFAASGHSIQSISRSDGRVTSIWPRDELEDWTESDSEDHERPTKRRKTGTTANSAPRREASELSDASIEIVAEGKERQKGERRRPKLPDTTPPNISHLIASTKTNRIIAVTVEDKAVRVFSVSRNGQLRQLSSRPMPKKACAITLTPDEQTILTADKFGDVYSLPLHPSLDYQPVEKVHTPKEFKPSATELTVHTKGNLDALRQQQLQKQQKARKEGPDFEHKLLLGHVSLLTDLAIAKKSIDGKIRHFIITADRDEHIRVSRGIPQTHVIHAFCLGHTEFVSKLCVLPWNEDVLVAGNGETSLRIFDWHSGQQKARYDIVEALGDDIRSYLAPDRPTDKLAVSGIWPLELTGKEETDTVRALLVALEGLPLLFIFHVDEYQVSYCQTLKLEGNILDVAILEGHKQIAVCIDTVHKSGSFKEVRTEEESADSVHVFALTSVLVAVNGQQVPSILPVLENGIRTEVVLMQEPEKSNATNGDAKQRGWERSYNSLGEVIYGLENLRKRRGAAPDEDGEEDPDEEEKEVM